VEAYVPGVTGAVAAAAVQNNSGTLVYSIKVPGDDPGTTPIEGGSEGDVLTFKINDRVMAQGVWHGGSSTQLDLHPPEAKPGGPYTGNEGASISFTGTASDWGTDIDAYQWDWNNDGVYDATGASANHTWNNPGTYPVHLKVTDAQKGEGITSVNVVVNNIPPSNVDAGGPYTGTSGQSVALNGSATCAAVDTCSYAWDLDGNGLYNDATGASINVVWYATGPHTVGLQVTDDDGVSATDTATVNINPDTQNIALVAGWNLISFRLHPTSTAIADVLSSINGNYTLVYGWNGNWVRYDPSVGYGNTLSNLDETMGIWIKMNTAGTLTINGAAADTTNISLKSGWNLVGCPASGSMVLPDAFSLNGLGSDFTLVYAYHASDTSNPWKKFDLSGPAYANDLSQLDPAYGYWINSGGAHTWSVDY
jgi:hypothetical protein